MKIENLNKNEIIIDGYKLFIGENEIDSGLWSFMITHQYVQDLVSASLLVVHEIIEVQDEVLHESESTD